MQIRNNKAGMNLVYQESFLKIFGKIFQDCSSITYLDISQNSLITSINQGKAGSISYYFSQAVEISTLKTLKINNMENLYILDVAGVHLS